ncbi:predicted protein [Naegleria gruberi]|uniref:Predicted protein n=1 Tax=Naegleria gruberi TaxID=5762 RepID=D2V8W5_NAEGR|nr:uncharacterized protein NAEGRDRAFT_65306 [Naegleria gruberi]EFC46873.1 predicted protein [Naegleria gruberi]|eukprot:XP_002679617.1 predicted protein [Naegleria gruberi strain NEG-M]
MLSKYSSRFLLIFTTVFLYQVVLVLAVTYNDLVPKATGYKMGAKVYNRNLKTPGTPGVSNWHVAQWENAYELNAFNNQYSVANPSSRVVFTPGNDTIELALNGNLLGCGVEANLFAEPTTSNTYDTAPFVPAIEGPLANNGKQLLHTINVRPYYIQQVASSCITQATFITSFVLKNYDAPSLTLFYQLNLHYASVSPSRVPNKNWFFNGAATNTTNTWGYDDVIASYELTYPTVGQTLVFSKDVKPRLRQVVADTANNIPAAYKNPDRWYIQSTYYGPHVWGGLITTYFASNFRLAEMW